MWNVATAKAPVPNLAPVWTDLASRAWDFVHESASWLSPGAQDDRGRKLLQELYAMYETFTAQGVGVEAAPAEPPPVPASVNPANKEEPSVASVFADAESALVLCVVGFLLVEGMGKR